MNESTSFLTEVDLTIGRPSDDVRTVKLYECGEFVVARRVSPVEAIEIAAKTGLQLMPFDETALAAKKIKTTLNINEVFVLDIAVPPAVDCPELGLVYNRDMTLFRCYDATRNNEVKRGCDKMCAIFTKEIGASPKNQFVRDVIGAIRSALSIANSNNTQMHRRAVVGKRLVSHESIKNCHLIRFDGQFINMGGVSAEKNTVEAVLRVLPPVWVD